MRERTIEMWILMPINIPAYVIAYGRDIIEAPTSVEIKDRAAPSTVRPLS